QVTSIVTLVTLITMIASSYFIIFGNKLFEFLSKQPFFSFFLKHDAHQERLLNSVKQKKYEIVFLGFNKTGKSIFSQLAVKKEKTMVIDFDPNVVKQCIKEKFHAFYGDVADIETIDLLKGKNPKIVVSTILDYNTSALLLKKLSKEKKVTKVCLAFDLQKAKKLYELGADLVIVPSIVAGKVAGEILSKLLKDKKHLKNLRAEALLHFEGIKSV
ncbi:MAG: NAD-binding protein, partial [Candidatus Diapherotrites archaeon]|nr:NAD-binding protein [Candidatus Diapherotrites archaeon]